MSDRIQELRDALAKLGFIIRRDEHGGYSIEGGVPGNITLGRAITLLIKTAGLAAEALDGWEKAEQRAKDNAGDYMAMEHQKEGWQERAEQAEADRDTYRAAWNRADRELAELREAAQAVYNDLNEHLTDRSAGDLLGTAVRLTRLHALRAALTQENNE